MPLVGNYFAVLRPRSRRAAEYSGGVAQLGERVNGIHEVRGSIPLASIRVGGATAGATKCRCEGRAERSRLEPFGPRE